MTYNSTIDKIQECVITIDMLYRNMQEVVNELHDRKVQPKSNLFKVINRHNNIQLCNFIEELSFLDAIAKNDEYLKDTLYVIAPIRRIFKNWPDIKNVRNKMFAHYNRDKQKKFYPWWITLKQAKIPQSYMEHQFILILCKMIHNIVLSRHLDSFNRAYILLKQEYEECLTNINSTPDVLSPQDQQTTLNDLFKEIEKRGIEKNVELYQDVVATAMKSSN